MNGQPDTATAIAALDQAMKALILAKSALLGEPTAALLISTQDLGGAQASPGNPYGSFERGSYDAASAAEAGRCPGEMGFQCYRQAGHDGAHHSRHCGVSWGGAVSQNCIREDGHTGQHMDSEDVRWGPGEVAEGVPGWNDPLPGFCPSYWDNPEGRMYCAERTGHTGNHATAEGIEWGGDWKTAEPVDGAR